MGKIASFFYNNVYLIDLLFVVLMILSSYLSYRQQRYFNFDSKKLKNLDNHPLIKKYHLDELKKKPDLEPINKKMFIGSAICTLIGGALCAVLALFKLEDTVCLLIGVGLALALDAYVQTKICDKIGEQYKHRKELAEYNQE